MGKPPLLIQGVCSKINQELFSTIENRRGLQIILKKILEKLKLKHPKKNITSISNNINENEQLQQHET